MIKPRFPFLPKGRGSGGILPWVIAVMMYLSGLAAVGALTLQTAMGNWSGELSRQLTVQVVHPDQQIRDEQAQAIVNLLQDYRGVDDVRILGESATDALLEPWLGSGNVTADLPIPVLIDIVLDPVAPATPETLSKLIAQKAPDARLDDHQRWLSQVKQLFGVVGGTLALVLGLVLLATIAIVVFGTRARLTLYERSVDVMHQIGADDDMIAREFQWRFLQQGIKGGAIGAFMALTTLGLLGFVASRAKEGLLPTLSLDVLMIFILLMIPPLSGLLTMITARLTVLRALKKMG